MNAPIDYRNATAALLAMVFWPLACTAARRRTHAAVRAGAFALGVVAVGLAFLTQSRGVVIGFTLGGVVALSLGPDRVRRAWVALFAIGAVAAVSGALLTPYDAFLARQGNSAPAIADAVGTLSLVAGVSAVLALLVALLDGGLRLSGAASARIGALARAGACCRGHRCRGGSRGGRR